MRRSLIGAHRRSHWSPRVRRISRLPCRTRWLDLGPRRVGSRPSGRSWRTCPADTGMAFVLVTHLAPDQKSYLTEILERYTHIPVDPVVHGTQPKPNHLYVLQPGQRVQLRAGAFFVEERHAEAAWTACHRYLLPFAGQRAEESCHWRCALRGGLGWRLRPEGD